MRYVTVVASMSAAILAGCTSLLPTPPEELVRERAEARYEHLMAARWDEAFAMATPAYQKTASLQRFKLKYDGIFMWVATRVDRVECAATVSDTVDRCEVMATITYRPPRVSSTNDRLFQDTWLLSDGNWYKFEE